MAIALTGSGSLFVKLGHLLACALDVNAARGSAIAAPDYTPTILSKITGNVIPDYAAGTAEPSVVQGVVTPRGVPAVPGGGIMAVHAAWQAQHKAFLQSLGQFMSTTLIDMANADTPQPTLTLQLAMGLLVAQMVANADYVAGSTVAAGAQANGVPAPHAAYSATGNSGPVIVVGTTDGHGYNLDNVLAETLTFTTTKDAQTGGQVKFQEPYSVAGQPDLSGGDMLSQLWPSGSACKASGSFVNAAANYPSGGTLLVNGEFATFTTANVPDNWTILTGSAGTAILQALTGYQDASCLEMVGDGSTLTSIVQKFNVAPTTTVGAGGTAANLLALPDTPFAFNCWVKTPVIPAAGKIQFDLIDSGGTIINNDAGNANSIVVDLTSGGLNSTAWNNITGVFSLPAADTANTPIALRIWQPTGNALTNTRVLYIDRVALAPMTPLYGGSAAVAGVGGGPFVAAFSGNLQTLVNDFWTCAMTNTWGKWPQHFQRFFNMASMGLRLPTAGSTLIATTLIA